MAVLHDYVCAAHGGFESYTGKCPQGCPERFIQKVFLKAPGLTSDRTKNTDKTLRQLALDFDMTDMNNRGGDPVKKPDSAAEKRLREFNEMMAPKWGGMAEGKSAVPDTLAQHRVMPDNVLSQVKENVVLTGPKPAPVASFGSAADIKV